MEIRAYTLVLMDMSFLEMHTANVHHRVSGLERHLHVVYTIVECSGIQSLEPRPVMEQRLVANAPSSATLVITKVPAAITELVHLQSSGVVPRSLVRFANVVLWRNLLMAQKTV